MSFLAIFLGGVAFTAAAVVVLALAYRCQHGPLGPLVVVDPAAKAALRAAREVPQ